jgi:hypothetical protein
MPATKITERLFGLRRIDSFCRNRFARHAVQRARFCSRSTPCRTRVEACG